MKNVKAEIRYLIVFLGMTALAVLGVFWNINTGSVDISLTEIVQIIFLKANAGSMESNIIWKIRLPRLLSAAVLGGALSVSGFLLQTFFRNPIAGPFVLGISSGAKMFVGIVTIGFAGGAVMISNSLLVLAAFAGSLLSMGCVLLFAHRVRNMSMLLVIGIMIGYICSAVTDFMITFASEYNIANLTHWSMGSFSGMNWDNLTMASILILFTMIAAMLVSKPMAAYQLGEGYAKSMGVSVKWFRVVLIILSSLLSACVTAFVGPISFVGIAVPQITKVLMKTSRPIIIIPAGFLAGAVFCMYCDLIARTAFAPVELSIGTVTAVFGAPIVIWMMAAARRRGGAND